MTVWARIELRRSRTAKQKTYVIAGGDGSDENGPFVWTYVPETYLVETYQHYETQAELEADGVFHQTVWQCASFEQIACPPRSNYDE